MRVTRLEIFGFKSFVERFVLNFDHNMIGVVGPNGCGKSNIVDSLRWVLGETHAKQLRGSVFDDLIFNGSDSRRPLGMAEVSITVRPNEGWANGHPVLTGAEQPTSPVTRRDRTAKFDEGDSDEGSIVAGDENLEIEPSLEVISGDFIETAPEEHLNGNHAAESPTKPSSSTTLAEVRPSVITEIPGLLNATEIQFTRRLYRSGESEYFINRVPCRLRDMTDMYRLIGLGARGLSIVQQGEIGQFISRKPIERRELLEEAAGISGFRARMEAAQRRLEKTAENMARLRDIMVEVEKQVRVLSRQAKRARDRNELKAELKAEELELYRAKVAKLDLGRRELLRTIGRLGEELEQAQGELLHREATQGELQAKLDGLEVRISDERRERDSLQAILNGEQARLNELRLDLALLEGRIESANSSIGRIEQRRAQIADEIRQRLLAAESLRPRVREIEALHAAAEASLSNLQREHSEKRAGWTSSVAENELPESLAAEIENLTLQADERGTLESDRQRLEQGLREKRSALDRARKDHGAKQVELARVESQAESLRRQLEALAEHVAAEVGSPESAEGQRVLVSVIQVPEELQTAVHAVLGERGNYLVMDEAHAAAARYQKSSSQGRLGVIEKSPVVGANLSETFRRLRERLPSVRVLVQELQIEAGYERACEAILGGVFVVENMAEGILCAELLRELGQLTALVVTKSGEVLSSWGWYTTEGQGKAYAFTRQLAELDVRAAAIREELLVCEEKGKLAEQQVESVESELNSRSESLKALSEIDRRLQNLREERRRLERQQEELRRDEERRLREAMFAEERVAQDKLRAVFTDLSQAQSALGMEERRVSDLQAELESLGAEQIKVAADLEALRAERQNLEHDLERGVENSKLDVSEIRVQLARLDESLRILEDERKPIRLQYAEIADDVAKSRAVVHERQEQHGRANLGIERFVLELTMLRDDMQRQYPEIEPPSAEELDAVRTRAGDDIDSLILELQEGSGRLRRRMEREGEVDPQSIELFEQEETRLRSMEAQYEDLQSASEILARTIRQLKEISKERFVATFKSVNEKFQVLVPRLFGGGAGHLELINPEDPLTSGVELVVRPPGKKLTNMELLSGGEKALVAVSVLVSMFLHRPSPICVLDEVDAPLDEANLERYLGLISEISQSTQFLVITHNKRTMASAGRLVGITMQEKGVSTALSVTLDESEEEIDRWVANS